MNNFGEHSRANLGETPNERAQLATDGNALLWRFLEISVHFLLYLRGIYPSTAFVKRQWQRVPVMECRSPDLQEYVVRVLNCVRKEKGVKKLMVDLLENHQVVERYVFELTRCKPAELGILDEVQESKTTELLRSCLLKIGVLDSFMEPLDPRYEESRSFSFLIEVETGADSPEGPALRVGEEAILKGKLEDAWVGVSDEEGAFNSGSTGESMLIPLKGVRLPWLKLQLYALKLNQGDKKAPARE